MRGYDPHVVSWDDPEDYPEDDDDPDEPHPGDPPVEGDPLFPRTVTERTEFKPFIPEIRQRRLLDINNHLATRDYLEKTREERRARQGYK